MSAQPHIVPFDTLKYAKRLQSANVPPEQAEVLAEALQETLGQAFQAAEVATRSDVEGLHAKIDNVNTDMKTAVERLHTKIDNVNTDMKTGFSLVQKDIAALEQRLDTKIEAQTNKIIIRIGGAVVAVLVALEVINRFWPKV